MSSRALLKLIMPARADSLKPLRASVARVLEKTRIEQTTKERIVLSIDEACANVIRHAYGGDCAKRITVMLEFRQGRIRIRIRDEASPVNPDCVRPRDLSECRPGGLGINIIDKTMDRWQLRPLKNKRGNVLLMEKKILAARTRNLEKII